MALENNAVTYPDYFGEGIHLVYTPTANGVKEDIVLDAYTGVNSFTFMLNTRGLNLYQANGRYFLAPGKGSELRFDLGDIVSFDAKGRFSIGTMTAETVSAGNLYRLTVTVDEEFLTDENTAYPVSIDPAFKVSDNTHGAGAIEDATIYQGMPTLNTGGWQYMHCGYYDSTYQTARIAYRLTGFISDNRYQTMDVSEISSVYFYVREATGSAGVVVNLHVINSNWSESNITWNSHGNSYAAHVFASASPSYGNVAEYNITNLVRDWWTEDTPEYGFMLVSTNETSIDKAIFSSEYTTADYRPYVTMNYREGSISTSIDEDSIEILEGNAATLHATGAPSDSITWSSSNTSVATVNNGVVTAVGAGTATITASASGGSSDSCTVYVRLRDGVYKLKSIISGNPVGLNSSNAVFRSPTPTESELPYQLWKIAHLGSGTYSVRAMTKYTSGLYLDDDSANLNVCIAPIGSTDTIADVDINGRWTIIHTTAGYVFKTEGMLNYALKSEQSDAAIGQNIVVSAYSSSNPAFAWELNAESGIFLNRIDSGAGSGRLATAGNTFKSVFIGEAKTLSQLGLVAQAYSINSGFPVKQSISWSSGNSDIVSVTSGGTITGRSNGSVIITGSCPNSGITQQVQFTARIKRAYTFGGEILEGQPVYAAHSTWEAMGYHADMDNKATNDLLELEVLNSDIVYFSAHGFQNNIRFIDGSCLVGGTTQQSFEDAVYIDNYAIWDANLYVYESCLTASTLTTADNLCAATVDAGAECVLGWSVEVVDKVFERWQQKFQCQLILGKTVQEATNYANSFMYVDPDSERDYYGDVKACRIYGNPNLILSRSPYIPTDNPSDPDYIDLSNQNIPYSWNRSTEEIMRYFAEICEDFVFSEDTTITTLTSHDATDFVVDFLDGGSEYSEQLPIGFTVIVQDHKIIGIRNNTGESISAIQNDLSDNEGNIFDYQGS